jgi:hypothetical protein
VIDILEDSTELFLTDALLTSEVVIEDLLWSEVLTDGIFTWEVPMDALFTWEVVTIISVGWTGSNKEQMVSHKETSNWPISHFASMQVISYYFQNELFYGTEHIK